LYSPRQALDLTYDTHYKRFGWLCHDFIFLLFRSILFTPGRQVGGALSGAGSPPIGTLLWLRSWRTCFSYPSVHSVGQPPSYLLIRWGGLGGLLISFPCSLPLPFRPRTYVALYSETTFPPFATSPVLWFVSLDFPIFS